MVGLGLESPDTVKDDKAWSRGPRDFPLGLPSFNLTGVSSRRTPTGSTTGEEPQNLTPAAPIPSLRLSDQEAADITTHLLTLQK
jgi:hypothetical protein